MAGINIWSIMIHAGRDTIPLNKLPFIRSDMEIRIEIIVCSSLCTLLVFSCNPFQLEYSLKTKAYCIQELAVLITAMRRAKLTIKPPLHLSTIEAIGFIA